MHQKNGNQPGCGASSGAGLLVLHHKFRRSLTCDCDAGQLPPSTPIQPTSWQKSRVQVSIGGAVGLQESASSSRALLAGVLRLMVISSPSRFRARPFAIVHISAHRGRRFKLIVDAVCNRFWICDATDNLIRDIEETKENRGLICGRTHLPCRHSKVSKPDTHY